MPLRPDERVGDATERCCSEAVTRFAYPSRTRAPSASGATIGSSGSPLSPGDGLITAATVVTEVWDITRSLSADRLCSWAGLTPSEHSSGEHTRRGHHSKQGSRWLRWVLAEVAARLQADHVFEPSSTESLRGVAPRSPGSRSPNGCDPVLLRPSRRTWLPGVPGGPMRTSIVVGALASRHGLSRRPPI